MCQEGIGVVIVKSRDRERGANLVEFALIAPLLIMLVMGIIDFGWILSTQQDVRHGAREAARVAAVNTGSTAAMGTLVCGAMNVSSGVHRDLQQGRWRHRQHRFGHSHLTGHLPDRVRQVALCQRHLPDDLHRVGDLPTRTTRHLEQRSRDMSVIPNTSSARGSHIWPHHRSGAPARC